jgi:shikimate kinase
VDVDVYLEAGSDRSLPEIIEADGLEAFCRLEAEYILCLDTNGHVIATGGSAVYSEDAMRFLRDAGPIVWLDAPLNMLARRVGDLTRRGVVAGPGATLESLHAERVPLYRKWADIRIDCAGREIDQVVEAVAQALSDFRRG